MQIVELPVEKVFPRLDARPVNKGAVEELMNSIREIGIINPIRVRTTQKYVSGQLDDVYEISAGRHRYEAATRLNMATVPCVVAQDDDIRAELAMIDENLMRAELSPADRAKQIARRKEIYETLHPETKAGVAGGLARQGAADDKLSFADATAQAIGKDRRTVQRDASRGEKIAPDVLDTVAGTHLDKGAYLDTIKRLPEPEQRQKVASDLGKPAKPVKLADDPLNDFEAKEKQVAALMAAWNKAGLEAREEFLSRIDRPLMDRRYA